MNYFEQRYYDYKGFGEGDYIFSFFLPSELQDAATPRDLLALYRMLRGFTPDLSPHQIKPSTLREPAAMQVVETVADVLRGNDLTIHYCREQLSKQFSADEVAVLIGVCQSYMASVADTELSEEETRFLIGLNERIRQVQSDARLRISSMGHRLLDSGERCTFTVDYTFLMQEDHPDYRGLDCLLLFQSSDFIEAASPSELEAGIEQMRHYDKRDCNEKRHLDNPLYQVAHCSIFRDLEDRSAIPLRHLCRIGRIEVEVGISHVMEA